MGVQVDVPRGHDLPFGIEDFVAVAFLTRPILAILPLLMPTSARYAGTRVPSTIVPCLMIVSNSAMTYTSRDQLWALWVVTPANISQTASGSKPY